jgi:hypothetical protein
MSRVHVYFILACLCHFITIGAIKHLKVLNRHTVDYAVMDMDTGQVVRPDPNTNMPSRFVSESYAESMERPRQRRKELMVLTIAAASVTTFSLTYLCWGSILQAMLSALIGPYIVKLIRMTATLKDDPTGPI